MMEITEDTPPDMLSGAMDLIVHLPDGKKTKMSVERSTPMMDVLVQITNANHLQISGYMLQPLAIHSTPGIGEKMLPYYPNTPIGTLDMKDIRVIAKHRGMGSLQRSGFIHQPFESTFRLKVHLPRNQLYVERVSMNAYLHDIMAKMCEEKNLDVDRFELRHPGNLDQVLDLKLRLLDYHITEVYAVHKGSNRLSQVFSSSESIMAFRKDDERKQKQTHNGGGLFNFFKRSTSKSNGSGSLSSDNRSISPTQSDDSRSVSPPINSQPAPHKPKPPVRKRRPAPKPPSKEPDANHHRQLEGLTICHSRNSSDSSGYHEASILSDNANSSLPRARPRTQLESNKCNLQGMRVHSKSATSLAVSGRSKKKAPQPPVNQSTNTATKLDHTSPLVASSDAEHEEGVDDVQVEDSFQNDARMQKQVITESNHATNSQAAPLRCNSKTDLNIIKDAVPGIEMVEVEEKEFIPERVETDGLHTSASPDWEYQLPSPPTAFRDSSPVEENVTETAIAVNASILSSPELVEKLNNVKEMKSEEQSIMSLDSDDEKFISALSVENLEKRKKLVYNRELATSLKYCESDGESETWLASKRCSVLSELEDVLSSKPVESNKNLSRMKNPDLNLNASRCDSSLPNFKITTYDIPKNKINIFEDDSIRSSVERPQAVTMRNMTLNRGFPQRSESFNTWATSKQGIARSNSEMVAKPKSPKSDNSLSEESRQKSTLDITGLQSIEVMKAINSTLTSNSISTIDEVDSVPKALMPPQKEGKGQRPASLFGTTSINLTSWPKRTSFHEGASATESPSTVSIKVNGCEAISTQESGNVVIKIAPKSPRDEDTKRFINHTTAVGYRKPMSNINKVDTRMMSSRLPIVRSMELKKTFKDGTFASNTSVTHIRPEETVNGKLNHNNIFHTLNSTYAGLKHMNIPGTGSAKKTAHQDARGALLNEIRNFGGRKGLKTIQV